MKVLSFMCVLWLPMIPSKFTRMSFCIKTVLNSRMFSPPARTVSVGEGGVLLAHNAIVG